MATKISVTKCKVRGDSLWRVRWTEAGKVRRKFFVGRDSADAHASSIRGEAVAVSAQFKAMPASEQERLMALWNESQRRGVDLFKLVSAPVVSKSSVAIGDVINEYVRVKLAAGRQKASMACFRSVTGQLARGREQMPISAMGFADIEAFMLSRSSFTRTSYRAAISGLFNFAIRRGYIESNPCHRLEPVSVQRKPISVLTVDQTETALKWFRKNPRSLAWFILSTFAGLRPEEADQTTWGSINFDEGWIRVEAQTSKNRQRRVVYPLPMAMDWLRLAKRLKSRLPIYRVTRMLDLRGDPGRKGLKSELGFKIWPRDITRHTAASMWLAQCGSAATVATALGHAEHVLREHYMALVTKTDAEKFWALTV